MGERGLRCKHKRSMCLIYLTDLEAALAEAGNKGLVAVEVFDLVLDWQEAVSLGWISGHEVHDRLHRALYACPHLNKHVGLLKMHS